MEKNKRKNLIKIISFSAIVLGIVVLFILPSTRQWLSNIFSLFSNQEELKEYVKSFGIWAPLIFFIIQVVQVIVAPIPGNVTTLVGGALFGWVQGFILGQSGIIIGSILAFYLARIYGKPLVLKFVSQKTYDKYNRLFTGKGFLILLFIFLVPFFPDDALCLLAGLSTMPIGTFLILILVGRTPINFVTCLVGDGLLSLSIEQWIVVAVISLFIAGILIKYSSKIEDALYRKLKIGQKQKKIEDEEEK